MAAKQLMAFTAHRRSLFKHNQQLHVAFWLDHEMPARQSVFHQCIPCVEKRVANGCGLQYVQPARGAPKGGLAFRLAQAVHLSGPSAALHGDSCPRQHCARTGPVPHSVERQRLRPCARCRPDRGAGCLTLDRSAAFKHRRRSVLHRNVPAISIGRQ